VLAARKSIQTERIADESLRARFVAKGGFHFCTTRFKMLYDEITAKVVLLSFMPTSGDETRRP
jgi:hypothetical protein